MANELKTLIETLDLEPLEHNLFRGKSPQVGWQRVFGGQVIGQALVAASRTVGEQRFAHSLHGYFMRPGDPAVPIIYEVDRYRDGRSFTTRQVAAIQHGQPIFTMTASFHTTETGLAHQIPMPDVPAPEALPAEKEFVAQFRDRMPDAMRQYFERARPIELRTTDPAHYLSPRPGARPVHNVWFRATGRLADARALHQCVLAYASDMTLLDTCLVPHGHTLFDRSLMLASLDHALWFHGDFHADDWLLYVQDAPWSAGGRGLARGSIFSRDGKLVASVAQEGMMRIRRPRKDKN